MLSSVSPAMSGLSAAARRNDAPAGPPPNNKASDGAPVTAGAPMAEAAYQPPAAEPRTAVSRDGVEAASRSEENSGFDSTYAALRSSTPAYLAALDQSQAEEPPPDPNVDPAAARELKAREDRKDVAEDQARLEAVNAEVKKRFDIGASY